jgi:hypothetical protein
MELAMDENRRSRIATLMPVLQGLETAIRDLWLDEERSLDRRSAASRENAAGTASSDAVHHLEEATHGIRLVIEQLTTAQSDE